MSIIGNLKDLIFGAKPEPKFSDSDILAAKQRAETLAREFSESLGIAAQSKIRRIREERMQIAHEWLVELKKLAIKFPFLQLTNLQEIEARIIAVEAETRALPYGEVVDTSIKDIPDKVHQEGSGQNRQRLSEREEQTILMGIQGCFRVVNESIEIARKSKNLETKLSRLRVARDNLKEAQTQASQFSLEVGGFAEAEAEINRIDEAIKNGTPTEIAGMQQTDANAAYASTARNLLMEATALKKAKKYAEACDKLREAYSADGAENLFIEERLRLPMYLQLAGKNDEGWDELNRLYASHDQSFQPRIEHQMNVFLRKEKNESASNPVRVILRGDNKLMEDATASNGKMNNEMQNAPLPFEGVTAHTREMTALNAANIEAIKQNADIAPTMRWLSVLDSHTCILCGVRDGKEWDTLTLEPVGHSIPFTSPPLHRNCRCKMTPVTRLSKVADELGIGQRASSIGPVARTTTFGDFLKQRDAVFQDGVLGEDRAKIWRDAKLSLDQLVDESGRELTLAELRAKYC